MEGTVKSKDSMWRQNDGDHGWADKIKEITYKLERLQDGRTPRGLHEEEIYDDS